jgi:serine/threonine-protein kinase SRPK3
MVKAAWSYPVDIWNVGVMVWDLFEGKHMFHGNDPDGKGYSTRAHLAEVIGTLGPPPLDLLKQGIRSPEFFDEEGAYSGEATGSGENINFLRYREMDS